MRIHKYRFYDLESKTMIPVEKLDFKDNGDIIINDQFKADDNKYSLLEFIGVQDRNRVDIFQGDIVEIEAFDTKKKKAGTIKTVVDFVGWSFLFAPLTKVKNMENILLDPKKIKVIGNIYQDLEKVLKNDDETRALREGLKKKEEQRLKAEKLKEENKQ